MKNWKVTILVIVALIWLVDAKPWKSDSESSGTGSVSNVGTVSGNGNSDMSYNEEKEYTCPRCDGSGECRRCKGTGTYYNSFTGETKNCAVCRDGSGVCQTCYGDGAITASTYEQVMANESRRAANSRSGGSTGDTGDSGDTGVTGSTYEEVEYCWVCKSTGRCKICGGSGTYRNGFDMSQVLPCTACTHGSIEDVGKCQICGGDGILYN